MSNFKSIPFIAHEEAMWLKDRAIKRLTRGVIAMSIVCISTNAVWLYRLHKKG